MISRKILFRTVLPAVFFLTACAPRGYHSPVVSSAPQVYTHSFVWPLKGSLAVPYGGQEESVTIKGIVIEGREGENVVAVLDGRVSFIDERLKGYGRTIILEHTQDLSTVYARSAKILVSPGQWVRQGQAIAQVGREGRGSVPQLYFEVRRKARAENPAQYLK